MRKLFYLVVSIVIFGLVISGCFFHVVPPLGQDGSIDMIKDAESYKTNLIAGQHTIAGSITVSNDDEKIIITYETADNWLINATHLYVGTTIPTNSVPGKFPYKHEELGGVTTDTYEIPLEDLGAGLFDIIYIAAHADLIKEEVEESGWAEGTVIRPGKNWAMYFVYQTPASTKGSVYGMVMIPELIRSKDLSGWVPLPGASVTLTDSTGQIHSVITDVNGNYSFSQVAPGSNYVITASGEVGGNTIVLKDIVPQLESGEQYDAGTADAESTALALIVEDILDKDLEPDLNAIQQSNSYNELVNQVFLYLKQHYNVITVPEIKNLVYNGLDEVFEPWDGLFCGEGWNTYSFEDLEPPGKNYWSNSINNVWKDDQGYLHLRIIKRDDKWYCASVETQQVGWGFGTYEFELGEVKMGVRNEDGEITYPDYFNSLDPNVTIGLFTYDGHPNCHKGHNEIDIEFCKGGDISANLGHFGVVYDAPDDADDTFIRNDYSFPADLGDYSTHSFTWTPSNMVFYSSEMTFCPLYPESFEYLGGIFGSNEGYGYIPELGKEQVMMNLWLYDDSHSGIQGFPADSKVEEVEVVIKNFRFEPLEDSFECIDNIGAWTITGYDPYCIKTFEEGSIPDRSILVYWPKIAGAEEYRVFRSVNGDSNFDLVYSGDGMNAEGLDVDSEIGWYDFDTTPGNSYSYKVSCVVNGQESIPSDVVTRSVWLPECSLASPPDYNPEDPYDQPVTEPDPLFEWNPVGISSYPYQGDIQSGESQIWVVAYNTPYPEVNQGEQIWEEPFDDLTTSSTRFDPNMASTPLVPGPDHIYAWETKGIGYDYNEDIISMSWSGARHFFYMEQPEIIEPPIEYIEGRAGTYHSTRSRSISRNISNDDSVTALYYSGNLSDALSKGGITNIIDIIWPAYDNCTGYRVYRSKNSSEYSIILDWDTSGIISNRFGLYDHDVEIGNTYRYYVTAYNDTENWETVQSNIYTIEINNETFLPPIYLDQPQDYGQVDDPNYLFKWTPVGNILPYGDVVEGQTWLRIFDADTLSSLWAPLYSDNFTTSQVTYNGDTLISGNTYRWYVRGYGFDANGQIIAESDSEDWEFTYNANNIIDGDITNVSPLTDPFTLDTQYTTNVYVENIGNTSHTFKVIASEPSGTDFEITEKSITLSAGATNSLSFKYQFYGTETCRTLTFNLYDSSNNLLKTYTTGSLCPEPTTVSAPTGVDATDGTYTDKVKITWNSVSGATHYKVYRARASNDTKVALTGWQTSTSYDDTSADFCWFYSYWVKAATNSSGANASDYSDYNTGWRRLEAPQNVTASSGEVDKTVISWDPVERAVYYRVYRGLSTGSKIPISDWFQTTTYQYNDYTGEVNKIYWYWVKAAYNTSGLMESDWSDPVLGYRK